LSFVRRLKSLLIQETEYLKRLLLYIHRNPLRAKIVERLEAYPWSSCRALAYGRGAPTWFDVRRVYEQFDLDARGFRQAVRRYDEPADDLLSSLYYGLVLGSEAVVQELRRRMEGQAQRDQPQWRALHSYGTIQQHLAQYRRMLGIDSRQYARLLVPIRRCERPLRDVLMYLLWRQGRFSLVAIGEPFGVKGSAVSQTCRRAERHLQTTPKLRRQLRTLLH
jgi:hypothetical protein